MPNQQDAFQEVLCLRDGRGWGCRICTEGFFWHEETCLARNTKCRAFRNAEQCLACASTHFMEVDGVCRDKSEFVWGARKGASGHEDERAADAEKGDGNGACGANDSARGAIECTRAGVDEQEVEHTAGALKGADKGAWGTFKATENCTVQGTAAGSKNGDGKVEDNLRSYQ